MATKTWEESAVGEGYYVEGEGEGEDYGEDDGKDEGAWGDGYAEGEGEGDGYGEGDEKDESAWGDADANGSNGDVVGSGFPELDAWDGAEEEKWAALEAELASLDETATPTVCRFLRAEIERRKSVAANPEFIRRKAESVKLVQKMFVDVDAAYPDFNYVGKILGPAGRHAKRIAQEANVKLAIQGKGSSKDKEKEEEQLLSGSPEFEHLKQPLHVRVESVSSPLRAWENMQRAINMLTPLMTSENEGSDAPTTAVGANGVVRAVLGARMPRATPRPAPLAPNSPYAYYPAPPWDYGMMRSGFGKVPPSRGRGRGRPRGRPY